MVASFLCDVRHSSDVFVRSFSWAFFFFWGTSSIHCDVSTAQYLPLPGRLYHRWRLRDTKIASACLTVGEPTVIQEVIFGYVLCAEAKYRSSVINSRFCGWWAVLRRSRNVNSQDHAAEHFACARQPVPSEYLLLSHVYM